MTDTPQIEPRSVTPGGLPYPEPTDALMLGADAIKALAQAIEARAWWSFIRWNGGTLGSASDAAMTGWDLKESNFATGEPGEVIGVICPKSGLYRVEAFVSFVNSFPTGNPQFSVGVKTGGTGTPAIAVCEIAAQSGEQSTAGNQRRDYYANGIIRVSQGDTIRGFMNNFQGISALTFAGSAGAAPRGNRFSSRFAGWWFAP